MGRARRAAGRRRLAEGVWERSPARLEIALRNPDVDRGNRAAVPDLRPDDVIGSPYSVRDYVVDARFGGRDSLAAARKALADRRLGLILDYVPNHVAPDHPWIAAKPGCFIAGSDQDLADTPTRSSAPPAVSSPTGATHISRRGQTSRS